MGHTVQKGMDVGGQDNLQELVRGIVLQAAHGGGGVVEADALVLQEGDDEVKAEGLCLGVHEMVLVAKENEALYAPVVVDEVGIVEVHAPALPLRRETAQEEHTAVLWQKGVQRMVLYAIDRAGNVLKVEEGDEGIHIRLAYLFLLISYWHRFYYICYFLQRMPYGGSGQAKTTSTKVQKSFESNATLLNRNLNDRQPLFRVVLIPCTVNVACAWRAGNFVSLLLHVGKSFGE